MTLGQGRPTRAAGEVKPNRAMRALGELLRQDELEPPELFDASLEVLIRQFRVDHALITRLSGGQLDTFWWVQADHGAPEPTAVPQSLRLCERVLEELDGHLVLGTVTRAEGGTWLRAFAGVVLREGGRPVGTLAVLHSQPFSFTNDDLDFIKSVAGLLGRAMEIENLKYQLMVSQESMALYSAVVQDSALETATTGLPNGRFLEIWMKGHLHRARRHKEALCLALWEGKFSGETLRGIAQGLRGDDLLVEVARDRFLLLLPQTLKEGALILLNRIHLALGQPPVGATLWLPDRDDLRMGAAQRRAEQARQEAARIGGAGGVCWKLHTLVNLDEPPG